MALDHLTTEPFREIIVTDVEFLFDFGLKDSITLFDGDVLDHNPTLGTIEVILAPKDLGRFPEYISYQTSKIIVMRKCQRTVQVKITQPPPPPPLPPTPSDPAGSAAPSAPFPTSPESSNPVDSDSPAAAPPRGRRIGSPSARPVRRRKTPRLPDTPRTGTSPAAGPAETMDERTFDFDSGGDPDGTP